jgi:hypothetical protein
VECVETDQRNDLCGHRPGSTAILLAVLQASEGAMRSRISVERLLGLRQSAHIRIMTRKCSKGNPDPSRASVLDAVGIPAAGHGDRVVPPDSVDAGDSRGAADGVGPARGNSGCNSADRGHNASRERTSPRNFCHDRPVAAELLRHAPPSALAGGARQRQWLRGTLEPVLCGVPDEGRHTGTPSLTTAGFLPCLPPSTTHYNFQPVG